MCLREKKIASIEQQRAFALSTARIRAIDSARRARRNLSRVDRPRIDFVSAAELRASRSNLQGGSDCTDSQWTPADGSR
jgi:hypothetical protein